MRDRHNHICSMLLYNIVLYVGICPSSDISFPNICYWRNKGFCITSEASQLMMSLQHIKHIDLHICIYITVYLHTYYYRIFFVMGQTVLHALPVGMLTQYARHRCAFFGSAWHVVLLICDIYVWVQHFCAHTNQSSMFPGNNLVIKRDVKQDVLQYIIF